MKKLLVLFLTFSFFLHPLFAFADSSPFPEDTGWGNMTTTRINTSDNSDAACSATCDNSDDAQMSDFSFGIPSGATINGIQVVTEMAEGASADNILVDFSLSWNDGTSFTSVKTATVDGTTDADYTVGGSSDTWGRTWTDTELANGTFRLRLDKNPSVDNLFVDYLRVKVHYTTGGGTSTTTTAYIHTDHLSGTSAITNDHKDIIQVLDYYPYGSIRVNTKEPTAHFDERRKFIGQYYDEDTELSYLNARYYDGARGQFTSQDPTHLAIGDPARLESVTGKDQQYFLSDPQLLNSYAYARGNPIRYSDPQGTYIESGFDVAMLGLSLYQFYQEPSWTNAGGVLLDAGSLALPGVPAVGGMALRAGKAADGAYSVYQGLDAAGTVRYVGITGRDPAVRIGEHLKAIGTGREALKYSVMDGTGNLTRDGARLIEQSVINTNGLQKNGGTLLNKINSISPSSQLYKSVPNGGGSGGSSLGGVLNSLSSALKSLSNALSKLKK